MIGFITGFVTFMISFYFLFRVPSQISLFGLKITYFQLFSGFVIFSLSFLIDLFFVHRVLVRNSTKEITHSERYIHQIFEMTLKCASFSFFLKAYFMTNAFNFSFYIAILGCFLITNAIIITILMYWMSSIEISITNVANTIDVHIVEIIPFIHKQRLSLFNKSVTNLFLAITPYSSKLKKIQLIEEDLDEFSWLSLEDIQNTTQNNDQFICFLVSNKNDFARNLSFRLGTKISTKSLIGVLNIINEIISISVIKLEYPKQMTFQKPNLLEHQSQV